MGTFLHLCAQQQQQENSAYLAYGAEQAEQDHRHSPSFYPAAQAGREVRHPHHPHQQQQAQQQQESAYTPSFLSIAEAYPNDAGHHFLGVYSPGGTYAAALGAAPVGMDNGMQSVDAFAAYT